MQRNCKTALQAACAGSTPTATKFLTATTLCSEYLLRQAADISGDTRLSALFTEYEQRYLQNDLNNIWRPLFYPATWVPVRQERLAGLSYYNQHFIYALSCDDTLGTIAGIRAQNTPNFCDQHLLKPACATHQLMGIRLLQSRKCGDAQTLNNTARALQQRITRQLFWDPRLVDVYIQRALMLADSPAATSLKPIWIRRIIDAQTNDGGWGNFQPLIGLGSGRYLGFGSRGFAIQAAQTTFHATVQGVLLTAIFNKRQRDGSQHTHCA